MPIGTFSPKSGLRVPFRLTMAASATALERRPQEPVLAIERPAPRSIAGPAVSAVLEDAEVQPELRADRLPVRHDPA
jgi:hypothetical protein